MIPKMGIKIAVVMDVMGESMNNREKEYIIMEQVIGVMNKLVEKEFIMMEQGMGVMHKLVDKQGTVEL